MTYIFYLICTSEPLMFSHVRHANECAIIQLGAFLAGALLAETNFRTQIEADIRPFRGLLLGLFFVTTGTSIDMQVSHHYFHK